MKASGFGFTTGIKPGSLKGNSLSRDVSAGEVLSVPFGAGSHGMGTKRAVKELLKPLSGGVKQLRNSPEVLPQGKTVGVEIAGFLLTTVLPSTVRRM